MGTPNLSHAKCSKLLPIIKIFYSAPCHDSEQVYWLPLSSEQMTPGGKETKNWGMQTEKTIIMEIFLSSTSWVFIRFSWNWRRFSNRQQGNWRQVLVPFFFSWQNKTFFVKLTIRPQSRWARRLNGVLVRPKLS